MAGRPRLPEDRKRVKVQTYLPPRLYQAAQLIAESRNTSVSQVVADFALEGARAMRTATSSPRPTREPDEAGTTDP